MKLQVFLALLTPLLLVNINLGMSGPPDEVHKEIISIFDTLIQSSKDAESLIDQSEMSPDQKRRALFTEPDLEEDEDSKIKLRFQVLHKLNLGYHLNQ